METVAEPPAEDPVVENLVPEVEAEPEIESVRAPEEAPTIASVSENTIPEASTEQQAAPAIDEKAPVDEQVVDKDPQEEALATGTVPADQPTEAPEVPSDEEPMIKPPEPVVGPPAESTPPAAQLTTPVPEPVVESAATGKKAVVKIEIPVAPAATTAPDAVDGSEELVSDEDDAKVATAVQEIVPAEVETDASAGTPSLDIAPSVSTSETPAEDNVNTNTSDVETGNETVTTAVAYSSKPPFHQELDTELLAQAAYELKQSTLPANRFSKWLKSFKRMLRKDDLLSEALQEDFLYDIELESDSATDEPPAVDVQQSPQPPVQGDITEPEESKPVNIERTSPMDVTETEPGHETEATIPVKTENVAPSSTDPTPEAVADEDTVPVNAATEQEAPSSVEEVPIGESSAPTVVEQEEGEVPVGEAVAETPPVAPQSPGEQERIETKGEAHTTAASQHEDSPVTQVAAPTSEQIPDNPETSEPALSSEVESAGESSEVIPEESTEASTVADVSADATEEPTPDIEASQEALEIELEAQVSVAKPLPPVTDGFPETPPEGEKSATKNGTNGQEAKSAFEWNCLGNVYLKAGSYDEAISAYTKAIEMAPKVGWPYRNLASAYFYKGMTAVAIPLYKRSIDLLSNNAEKAASLNKLGDAYRQLGDYQNAMTAYQKADDLNAGINSLLTRARMLVSNGGQD
jgi:tetratricopeptide (TPR) repeat protein